MDIPGGNQAALAVAAAVLGLGGLLGLVVVDDDSGDDDVTAASTADTTEPTTTTTLTGAAGPAGSGATAVPGNGASVTIAPTTTGVTTTTTRPTTSTSRATSSTAAAPSTTVASSVCGTGRASVTFTAKDLDTNALNSSFTPQATVDNQLSAPIEVEAIVLEVVYPGGETRTVRFTTAGTVIGPGTSASFTAEKITTPRRYESVRFTQFTYFTSGHPTACRVTTP